MAFTGGKVIMGVKGISKFYWAFGLVLLLLLVIGYFASRNYAALKETNDHVERTYMVKAETEHLQTLIKDIGIGVRGYVITGDSSFIQSFSEARNEVPANFQLLQKLVTNKTQKTRLDTLYDIISKNIKFSDHIIQIRNLGELKDSAQIALFRTSNSQLERISGLIDYIQTNQEIILADRKQQNEQSINRFNSFFILLLITILIIFISSFFVSKSNFTARKKAEKQYKVLFNTSADLICIAETSGYFREINPSFNKTLGYSKEELLSTPFIEFVHPDDVESTNAVMLQLNSGIPAVNFKNRYKCKDGSYKWLEWTATPVDTKIYATARDITPKIIAEEEISAVNRELDSFSYSVSHDLRAPLRAIVGYSKVLIEDYEDKLDSEGKNTLNIIVRNGLKMGRLIDDLLAFSRVNKQNVIKVNVNMNNMVETVLSDFEKKEVTHVDVRCQDLPDAWCDSNMMKQVVTNLISNAIKYSSKKDNIKVEIGFFKENGNNVYYVKDNGAGFEMAHYDKLFGVFQRLHSSSEFEGTGVGLALVQRIIHKHEGRIWAEGKIDEGATFYFTLPNLN